MMFPLRPEERVNRSTALNIRSSKLSQIHPVHGRPFQFRMFKSFPAWSLTVADVLESQEHKPAVQSEVRYPVILDVMKRLNIFKGFHPHKSWGEETNRHIP